MTLIHELRLSWGKVYPLAKVILMMATILTILDGFLLLNFLFGVIP